MNNYEPNEASNDSSQMAPGNNYNVPPQQPPYYSTNYVQQPQVEQKASVGFAILSFLIPIAGLIIFLTQKSKRPKTAKVSGICALVSFILNIIASIIIVVVSSTAIIGASYDIAESIDDYSSSYSDNSYADDALDYEDDSNGSAFDMEINVGYTYNLTLDNLPMGYTKDDLIWKSNDTSIATIDKSGNITGVSNGIVMISVKTNDGEYYKSFVIHVVE